jgi:hypothetical protein
MLAFLRKQMQELLEQRAALKTELDEHPQGAQLREAQT